MSKLITAGQQQGSNKLANKKLKTLLATTAMTAAGIIALSSPARAVDDFETPTGEVVVGGSASFDRPAEGLLNILQNTQRVVIDWNSFNIGAKAKTEFFQPNARSLAVNRVTGGATSPTMILGSLKANGRLMVLDRNGVFFGEGAQIDVAGIIASTGDIDTATIMNGADRFEFSNFGSGSIVNEGTINVADAGLAAFVSPTVVNSGVINAKLGKVAFGAGSKVTLDLYGDELIEIAVDDKLADALIENTGAINAEGGMVMMTANAAKEAIDNVINMGGVVDVSSVTQKGGKIVLNGGDSGVVNVTGTMIASGNGGGDVSVTGQNIMVSDTADISADGGDGEAIVYADNLAVVNGRMSATGGFIETSGSELAVGDSASISASLWLLDPLSIVIGSPLAGYQTVSAATISTSLSGGTSVTVQTGVDSAFTGGGGNNNEGDIRVRSDITKTGASTATLTLIAHDDIFVESNADITHATGGGNTGALNVTLFAGNDGAGNIDVLSGSTIFTNGGNASFMAVGGYVDINQAMNLSGGNFLFDAGTDIRIDADLTTGGTGFVLMNAGDDISVSNGNDIITGGGAVAMNAGTGVGNDISLNGDIYTHGGAASFVAGGNFLLDDSDDVISTLGSDAPVTVLASSFDLNGFIFAGTNTITIGRSTVGTIDVGDSNGSGFRIDQGEINHMFSGDLVIGNANTTNVTVDDVEMFAQFTQEDDELPTPSQGCENSSGSNPNCSQFFEMKDTNLTLRATDFVDIVGPLTMGTGWVMVDAPQLDLNSRVYSKDSLAGAATLMGDFRLFGAEQLTLINVLSPLASINQALAFADSSLMKTVDVDAGTYSENVLIYKNKVNLTGANAGVSGAGVRGAESTINGGIGTDGTAYAVKVTGDDVTIDGFSLTADGNGVSLDGTDGGISNAVVKNNVITTSDFLDTNDEGIEGVNVNGALIANNLLDGITNDGMKFTGGSNITIAGNTIVDADFKGLNLNSIAGLTVFGNTIYNTGDDGVEVNSSTGAVISSNAIGLHGGANNINGEGIDVNNSAGTQILNNIVMNTVSNGVSLNPSPGSVIQGNSIQDVGGDGINVSGSDNVVIGGFDFGQGNIISGAAGDGIDVTNSDGVSVINNGVFNSGLDGITVTDADNLYVGYNTVNTTGFGTLDTFHLDGINVVNGSNQTIEGNTVLNSGWDGINVWNTVNTDVLGNLVVNSYRSALAIGATSGGSSVQLNNFVDNWGGMWVSSTTDLLIDDNKVATTTGHHGIYLAGGDVSTTITDNAVFKTFADGIHVAGATDTYIANNDIGRNGSNVVQGDNNIGGDGILSINSTGTVAYRNEIEETTGDGIEFRDSDNAYADYNYINNAGVNGVYVNSSDGVNVRWNEILNAGNHGVKVNPSLGVLVHGNTITDAAVDGVNISNSDNAAVTWNTINSSGNNGVEIFNSDYASVWNNTINGTDATFDANGIFYTDSDFGSVRYNIVNNVYWDGIKVVNSDSTEVVGNTVNDARLAGIALFNSDTNSLANNILNSSGGSGIHSDTNLNTIISNNTINGTDAFYGILHMNGVNSLISGNTVNDATADGIYLYNQGGANTIIGNTVFSAGSPGAYNGITVGLTDNAVVDGNNVDDSGWDGIQVYSSNGVDVINNTVTDTLGASGIAILSSNSALVDNNDVSNSARLGIYLGISDGTTVSNNTVLNSGTANIAGPFGMFTDGIYLELASNTTVDANTVDGATGNGIRVGGGGNWAAAATTGNVVTNNTVDNAALNGIEVNDNNGVDVNGNFVGTLGGANNIGGNGIEVNNSHNADIMSNTVANTAGHGIYVDPSDYAIVSGNIINYAAGHGIFIDNSDFAQILNNQIGLTDLGMFGSGSGDGIHIANGSDSALVDGNQIITDGRGISLLGGTGHEVDNNTISTISWVNASDEGIYAENTADANIHDNHVTVADNAGIRVNGGSNATVNYNDIHGATAQGIDIQSVATAGVHSNTVHNTALEGILAQNTSGLSVTGNVVYNTGADGIHVGNSNGAYISTNFVGYTDNVLTAGAANNIGGDGIQLVDSHNVGIYNNAIINTVGNGIFVDPSDNVDISYNGINNAGGDGINLTDGNNGSIHHNTVNTTGGDGIEVYNNDGVQVYENNLYNLGADGVKVTDSDNVNVYDNTVSSAEGNGIYVANTNWVSVDDNNISYVDYDGIHVENFGYASVTDNSVNHTGDDGIETVNGDSVFIDYNTVSNAGYGDGYYYGYADYYGADGIHVRNVGGYYGYYGEYDVEVTDNDVDTTADDGIEVVDSGRTLIARNEVSNAGAGFSYYGYYSYYSWDGADGYGNDGIHVRNVHAYNDYYGEGESGGYYSGYDVEILDNDVSVTADDGIEVIHSGSTLIARNEVDHAGYVTRHYYGYYGEEGYYGEGYYGDYLALSHGGDQYGADGIHVRNVHGDGYYGAGYYGYYGFNPYSVVITENDVDTTADDGIEVVDSGRTRIELNEVDNAGATDGYYGYYGEGYYGSDDSFGADGIHVRNVHGDEEYYSYYGGYAVEIVDNDVDTTGDDGIQVLFSGDTLIDGNTVDNAGANHGARMFGADGISVISFGGDYPKGKQIAFFESEGDDYYDPTIIDIVNNTVDNSEDDGIEVIGSGVDVLVDNNDVTNSGGHGIALVTFGGFFGEEVPQNDEVFLLDGPVYPIFPVFGGGGFDSVVSNNNVTDSGDHGLSVEGPGHGDVIVFGNTMNDNPVGMYFESGAIDLTGATNTINGGHTGMLFRPFESFEAVFGDYGFETLIFEGFETVYAPLDIVNDTIGTTVFNGQSDFYVYLDDSAEWAPGFPTIIDGTDATYDGIHPTETGNVLTLGQYNQIENKIHDFIDEGFRGLLFFGVAPSGDIDQEDIFNQFGGFNPEGPGLNITITGLPSTSGTGLDVTLAGIAPAAGGEEGEEDAEDLAAIEPAAGGTEESCWADAVSEAQTGATVNFNYDGSVEALLEGSADCQNGEI